MRFLRPWLVIFLGALPLVATAVDNIVVLGLFKDKVMVEIDGKRRMLSAGQSSPEGVTLIAANSDKAILDVDGKRSTYRLGSHITTKYSKPAEGVSVQIWPDAYGMYQTQGNINGYPVNFLVDTGATLIAMNRNTARRLGLSYKLDGIEGRTSTASGIAKAYYIVLKKVKVGHILLHDIQAAVIDSDFPNEVLLGNSFLNRVKMSREGKRMDLQKP